MNEPTVTQTAAPQDLQFPNEEFRAHQPEASAPHLFHLPKVKTFTLKNGIEVFLVEHHELPIVFVILANREYRVLKHNIDAYRARFDVKSNKPYAHMDLSGPMLGFVDLAKGMGIAGTHVAKADDIEEAVAAAFKTGKPHLLEIEIEGKR